MRPALTEAMRRQRAAAAPSAPETDLPAVSWRAPAAPEPDAPARVRPVFETDSVRESAFRPAPAAEAAVRAAAVPVLPENPGGLLPFERREQRWILYR